MYDKNYEVKENIIIENNDEEAKKL